MKITALHKFCAQTRGGKAIGRLEDQTGQRSFCALAGIFFCELESLEEIGLANWTPDGFIGALFKVIGRYMPPPAGVQSPSLWGTRSRLEELFGKAGSDISITERDFAFRYRSPDHWLEIFRDFYGPTHKAFGALDADARAPFSEDLLDLIARNNVADDGTMVVPSAYLEVVVTRR